MVQYLSLPAKYRPQRFGDVIGQDAVCGVLSRSAFEKRVAPGYILSGTRGVGKTTLARIFAKALNCSTAPTKEPCLACTHCERISKGIFVDVVEMDAASNRSIEDIRNLRDSIQFAPMEGRYKVYILDEAHMLTREAYNALLKTLEEPPKNVTFIFASTDVHKFPATILSRCQHLVLHSVPLQTLRAYLGAVITKEGYTYEDEAIQLIAIRASGSIRDALSMLDQVMSVSDATVATEIVRKVLGIVGDTVFIQLLATICSGDILSVSGIVRTLLEEAIDIRYLLSSLASLWRSLFLYKQYGEHVWSTLGLTEVYHTVFKSVVASLSLPQIHAVWQMLIQNQKTVVESFDTGVALELLLYSITSIRSLLPIDCLTQAAVREGERVIASTREGLHDINTIAEEGRQPFSANVNITEVSAVTENVMETASASVAINDEAHSMVRKVSTPEECDLATSIMQYLKQQEVVRHIDRILYSVQVVDGHCFLYSVHDFKNREDIEKIAQMVRENFPQLTVVIADKSQKESYIDAMVSNNPTIQAVQNVFKVEESRIHLK